MRTYGTLQLLPGETPRSPSDWVIEAEPQVMLRLRRVFARAGRAVGKVRISCTPDNSRELAWFIERFPLVINERDRARLTELRQQQLDREAAIHTILRPDYTPPEFELAIPPREYQKVAAAMALRSGRLLLADELGTGKTASAIAVLSHPGALPAVVVVPTQLATQWARELARFAPRLNVHVARSSSAYSLTVGAFDRRTRTRPTAPYPDVVILGWHKLHGWVETLAPMTKTVVFDEAHELRHPDSRKWNAARYIAEAATTRMGLSATPVFNYGGEIYNVFDVLAPGELGERHEFNREWIAGEDRVRDPVALGAHLRDQGLMLRRTRKDVGRELPAVTKSVIHVDADTDALQSIETRATELARIILTQGGLHKGAQLHASEELSWRLRQATGIGKARAVAAFVRMVVESGEQVLLYGWHREVYEIWREELRNLPWTTQGGVANPVWYTGSESTAEKDRARDAFMSGSVPVMIMSLRAGQGVDGLQERCSVVVYGELDWSPAVHDQGTGRIDRDGQKRPVLVYYLVADQGSDPIVAEVNGIKRAQLEGIRDVGTEEPIRFDATGANIKRLAEHYLKRAASPDEPRPMNLVQDAIASGDA